MQRSLRTTDLNARVAGPKALGKIQFLKPGLIHNDDGKQGQFRWLSRVNWWIPINPSETAGTDDYPPPLTLHRLHSLLNYRRAPRLNLEPPLSQRLPPLHSSKTTGVYVGLSNPNLWPQTLFLSSGSECPVVSEWMTLWYANWTHPKPNSPAAAPPLLPPTSNNSTVSLRSFLSLP